VWLHGAEKSLRICFVASTEYRRVTDRQTDVRPDIAIHSIAR